MSLSLFPSLPMNSSFAAPPIEGSCNAFYGTWEWSQACTRAIGKLPWAQHRPGEPESVEFTIDQDPGPHNLPLQVQSGDCTIQVEMAGPHLPATVTLVPQDIIKMAEQVQGGCTKRTSYVGGWITADMSKLKDWVVAEETDLDAPYPTSTAFLTVTISHVVSDWLQVGNFDPHIAWILTRTEAAASLRARLPQLKDKLRERGERFRTQMTRMDLGRRVPWWRNPGVEDVNGTTDGGNATVGVLEPGVQTQ